MEFRPIPQYETYGISKDGLVKRLRDGRLLKVRKGAVHLSKDGVPKHFSINRLLRVTWDLQTLDTQQVIEGIYHEYSRHEWVDMYDNNRYQLTRDGLVWDKRLTRFRIPRVDSTGYKLITTNIHLHRALKLTFDFIPNYKDCHVHHKDNNKLNNHLDNLEWLTISQHMKISRYDDRAIAVTSECLNTGEIKLHLSIADCERYVGKNNKYGIKLNDKKSIYYKGYLITRTTPLEQEKQ